MTESNQNSTLIERLENLKKLNRGRFDYVLAHTDIESVDGTLKKIGKSKGWYYGFTEDERRELEELAAELHYEKAIHAYMLLQGASQKAAEVKIAGLEDRDHRVRQAASTEILDRTLGKPGSKEAEKPMTVNVNVSGLDRILEMVYGNQSK